MKLYHIFYEQKIYIWYIYIGTDNIFVYNKLLCEFIQKIYINHIMSFQHNFFSYLFTFK